MISLLKYRLRVTFFLLTLLTIQNSYSQEVKEEPYECFYAGFNLATPFGSIVKVNEVYGTYYYPLSFLASNLCISLHGEYRYKNFGLEFPVRIPLTKLDLSSIDEPTYNYYYNQLWNNNFEVGVKPKFYFHPQQKRFQYFISLGLALGESQGRKSAHYAQYTLDTISGYHTNYEGFNSWSTSVNGDPSLYTRAMAGYGVQIQYNNGFGILAELAVSMASGGYRNQYSSYSNYGNTSPELVLDYNYDYGRLQTIIQLNASVTYKWDR